MGKVPAQSLTEMLIEESGFFGWGRQDRAWCHHLVQPAGSGARGPDDKERGKSFLFSGYAPAPTAEPGKHPKPPPRTVFGLRRKSSPTTRYSDDVIHDAVCRNPALMNF